MTQATEMIETKEGLGGNGRKVQAQRKRRRRKGKRASRRRNGVVTGTSKLQKGANPQYHMIERAQSNIRGARCVKKSAPDGKSMAS